eukprot:555826-Prorocentrum_minimum.AAC.2
MTSLDTVTASVDCVSLAMEVGHAMSAAIPEMPRWLSYHGGRSQCRRQGDGRPTGARDLISTLKSCRNSGCYACARYFREDSLSKISLGRIAFAYWVTGPLRMPSVRGRARRSDQSG